MNGAERRHDKLRPFAKRATICATHARTPDLAGANTPYMRRCELAPTTTVSLQPLTKYPERFRAAQYTSISLEPAQHAISITPTSHCPYTAFQFSHLPYNSNSASPHTLNALLWQPPVNIDIPTW